MLNKKSNQGGVKYDSGKPRMSLIAPEALIEIAKVFTFGANKYGDHNWRGGIKYSRLLDACDRHIKAWQQRENFDRESGITHLAHAAANLIMLMVMEKTRPDLDDRYSSEETA